MRPFPTLLAAALSLLLGAAPAAAHHANQLLVTVDKPVVVIVDGQPLDYVDGTMRVELSNVTPGRHKVEIRSMLGKLLGEGELVFPEAGRDAIVRAEWKNGAFAVYDTAYVNAPPPAVIVIEQPPRASTTTSVYVGGGLLGPQATVTTSSSSNSTTVTTSTGYGLGGAVVVVEEHEHGAGRGPAVAVPATRNLTLRSKDGEWGSVYLDGKKVWEIRAGAQEKTITVGTGEHTLEVRDFMENATWCKGLLVVDGRTDLVVGIAEEQEVEVYNDRAAWRAW